MRRDLDALTVARLSAVAERVAGADSGAAAMGAVAQAAKDFFRAQTAALLALTEAGTHLRILAARGLSDSFLQQFKRPTGSGIYAEIVLGGMPVLLSEAATNAAERDELRLEHAVGSAMAVPVMAGHRPVGCLYCDHKLEGHFQREDLLVLRALGFLAALAVEKADLQDRASRLEVTDPQTGLFTYAHFLNRLSYEIQRALRYGEEVAVMLVRPRDLAAVAASHGPAAPRNVLCAVAAQVKENIRGVDFAARADSEQIAICLVHSDEEGLHAVSERLCALSGALSVVPSDEPGRDSTGYTVAMRLYVAGAVAPAHGRDSAALVASAQTALLAAFSSGAGQLVVFPGD